MRAAAVVKVAVGEGDMERLGGGPGVTRPQPRPAQVAGEAVEADPRVHQEVTVTPLSCADITRGHVMSRERVRDRFTFIKKMFAKFQENSKYFS